MKREDMVQHATRPACRARVLHLAMSAVLARGPKPHEVKEENKPPKVKVQTEDKSEAHDE